MAAARDQDAVQRLCWVSWLRFPVQIVCRRHWVTFCCELDTPLISIARWNCDSRKLLRCLRLVLSNRQLPGDFAPSKSPRSAGRGADHAAFSRCPRTRPSRGRQPWLSFTILSVLGKLDLIVYVDAHIKDTFLRTSLGRLPHKSAYSGPIPSVSGFRYSSF